MVQLVSCRFSRSFLPSMLSLKSLPSSSFILFFKQTADVFFHCPYFASWSVSRIIRSLFGFAIPVARSFSFVFEIKLKCLRGNAARYHHYKLSEKRNKFYFYGRTWIGRLKSNARAHTHTRPLYCCRCVRFDFNFIVAIVVAVVVVVVIWQPHQWAVQCNEDKEWNIMQYLIWMHSFLSEHNWCNEHHEDCAT